MKLRVAIWLQGGIGGGNFSQGYPPLLNFVMKLTGDYDLTIYSILPANEDFIPQGYCFRTVTRGISSRKLRTIFLCFLFLWDHLHKPYKLLHAFWVYPAGTIAVILGKLVATPSLVTIQGGEAAAIPEIPYGNMLKPGLKKWTLWTCEQANCLNSISAFLVSEMRKHGLKRENVVVIPFGPEMNTFKKIQKKKSTLLKIIHVANLTEVKDQYTLLKAFSLIVKKIPAELRIIGNDFMDGKLHAFSQNIGLTESVKFMGPIPNNQLSNHYAWADIMMHTSLHEGQSGVVMEAMACGVPVCGTRVGILYDLGNEYFETVEVGDYEGLASKVLQLWSDQSKYSVIKEKAFSWALQFDASWTVREFSHLYNTLINAKSK